MLTHYYPLPQLPISSALEAEMARIRNIIDGMRRRQPNRRACSAPSAETTATAMTEGDQAVNAAGKGRKRARSLATMEPTRVSKRLRGLGAETSFTGSNVAVAESTQERPRDETTAKEEGVGPLNNGEGRRRKFGRTQSSGTSTTVPDDEPRLLDSPFAPTFPPIPETSTPPSAAAETSSNTEASSSFSVLDSRLSATTSAQTSFSSTLYSQSSKRDAKRPEPGILIPPRVKISGHPSLRIKLNSKIIYRQTDLPQEEWRSDYFLARIDSFPMRLSIHESLQKDGYIILPSTVFPTIFEENENVTEETLRIFFDKHALPKQSLPDLNDFVNPNTGLLEPSRITYWAQISAHFNLPHNLDLLYHTTPGQWHHLIHLLPTFNLLRCFSLVTDTLGFRRAREMIHQEMARRIRCLKKGKRERSTKELWRLLKMGYEEMRVECGKWEGREAEMEGVWVSCPGCRVRPGFVGDTRQE